MDLTVTEVKESVSSSYTRDFVEFLNEACTNVHAVASCKRRFLGAGFIELKETDVWTLSIGGKYFFIRNLTTIIAFIVGKKYQPENGFTCVGAHTDSPCLKVKAVSCSTKSDMLVVNTQPYGGGLWHTWFDRDLGIAGHILSKGADGSISSTLVEIKKPVARIPNLAIHLTSGTERDSFKPNLQENAKAFLTATPSLINMPVAEGGAGKRVHPYLAAILSDASGISAGSIVDFELQLTDLQPPTTGGASDEFIFSGRLDNLCSAYQACRALIDCSSDAAIEEQSNIPLAMLFDHEEIGSNSCQGAGSSLFMDTIRHILESLTDGSHGALTRTLRKSFVVSADMAHALHPNYPATHDPAMAPKLKGGIVVKHNANQRYATSAVSATLFRECAVMAGVEVQEFSVRSDAGCGSTIGPILSTLSGITTVDCGSPQLSMHSIREMMASDDAYSGYLQMKSVFINHAAVSARIHI